MVPSTHRTYEQAVTMREHLLQHYNAHTYRVCIERHGPMNQPKYHPSYC